MAKKSKKKPQHVQLRNLTKNDIAALAVLEEVSYEVTLTKRVKEAIRLYPQELKRRQRGDIEIMKLETKVRHLTETIEGFTSAFDQLKKILD